MWTFSSTTGDLTEPEGAVIGHGYAGNGAGVLNPSLEAIPDVGPLPRGSYTIGDFMDRPVVGQFAAPLTPDPENEMYGRSGFFIHGPDEEDALTGTHTSSHGCIVLARSIREQIAASGDTDLQVA